MLETKVHISNIYGMIKNWQIANRQRKIAGFAHELGWLEMGIYVYPIETDKQEELNKRIDGIVGAVEQGDVAVVQLPTENGFEFDSLLLNKLRTYPDVKIILIWQSEKYYVEHHNQLLYLADCEIRPKEIFESLKYLNTLFVKKRLLNAVTQVVSQTNVSEDAIHIGMGIHDRDGTYSAWAATTIQSIIDHTKAEIIFHIVHDNTVNETIKRKLNYSLLGTKHKIYFHEIDPAVFERNKEQMGMYTIGALYRILLPEICCDIHRILYLDSDLLVNCDIQELWNTDISEYCLAAVPDIDVVEGRIWAYPVSAHEMDRKKYFNSGVIYMNLDKIRKKGNMRKLVGEYLEKNSKSNLPDQDALNVIYQSETLLLDRKWNYFMRHAQKRNEHNAKQCIYHYVGTKPILYMNLEAYQLYIEIAEKTAWGLEVLRKSISTSVNRQQARARMLSKIIHKIGKEKNMYFFYGQETDAMKNMYKIMSVNSKDSCRIGEKQEISGIIPYKKIDDLTQKKLDSSIVLVLPEADDGRAISNLEKMGFVIEKDFFVIPCLLNVLEGGYLI